MRYYVAITESQRASISSKHRSTSLRAAGIFFCFLEKAKVALLPGDTAAERACSPDEQKCGTCSSWCRENTENTRCAFCLIYALGDIQIWESAFGADRNPEGKPDSLFCCWRTRTHWSHTLASWFFRYSSWCLLEEQDWHTTWCDDEAENMLIALHMPRCPPFNHTTVFVFILLFSQFLTPKSISESTSSKCDPFFVTSPSHMHGSGVASMLAWTHRCISYTWWPVGQGSIWGLWIPKEHHHHNNSVLPEYKKKKHMLSSN